MNWETILPEKLATLAGEAAGSDGLRTLTMDNDAFAGFYERAARPLWAYLVRVSGDAALADDLMQESFVRFLAVDRPPRIEDGEVAMRRYLFRIATNLMRDHWRRPKSSSLEEVPEELMACAEVSGQSDTLAVLGPAMRQMRPRDRQILWLAYAEGYSHREIAEVTGLASASIRLLLFRARRKMADLLRAQARREPEETFGDMQMRREQ
jgi:RNA polymerase sigma-70 factor (ECF subfamily)